MSHRLKEDSANPCSVCHTLIDVCYVVCLFVHPFLCNVTGDVTDDRKT